VYGRKKLGKLNAFLSETGKVFANVQGRNEGGTIPRAPLLTSKLALLKA